MNTNPKDKPANPVERDERAFAPDRECVLLARHRRKFVARSTDHGPRPKILNVIPVANLMHIFACKLRLYSHTDKKIAYSTTLE